MNPVDIRAAPREPWYKYGVAFLMFEIALAIAVSGYSLYMTFNGLGGSSTRLASAQPVRTERRADKKHRSPRSFLETLTKPSSPGLSRRSR
jgi:hypothetical protein